MPGVGWLCVFTQICIRGHYHHYDAYKATTTCKMWSVQGFALVHSKISDKTENFKLNGIDASRKSNYFLWLIDVRFLFYFDHCTSFHCKQLVDCVHGQHVKTELWAFCIQMKVGSRLIALVPRRDQLVLSKERTCCRIKLHCLYFLCSVQLDCGSWSGIWYDSLQSSWSSNSTHVDC